LGQLAAIPTTFAIEDVQALARSQSQYLASVVRTLGVQLQGVPD